MAAKKNQKRKVVLYTTAFVAVTAIGAVLFLSSRSVAGFVFWALLDGGIELPT